MRFIIIWTRSKFTRHKQLVTGHADDIFYWPLGIALLVSFVQHGLQLLLTRPRTRKTSSGAPLLRTQKIVT